MDPVTKALAFTVVAKAERGEKRFVYGYAMVSATKEGQTIVDLQGDSISPEALEDASAEFVKFWRQGGEDHDGTAPNQLIASLVTTPELQKALGIPEGTLPVGWIVGFEVTPESFEKVKDGTRLWFSIEGEAVGSGAAA